MSLTPIPDDMDVRDIFPSDLTGMFSHKKKATLSSLISQDLLQYGQGLN